MQIHDPPQRRLVVRKDDGLISEVPIAGTPTPFSPHPQGTTRVPAGARAQLVGKEQPVAHLHLIKLASVVQLPAPVVLGEKVRSVPIADDPRIPDRPKGERQVVRILVKHDDLIARAKARQHLCGQAARGAGIAKRHTQNEATAEDDCCEQAGPETGTCIRPLSVIQPDEKSICNQAGERRQGGKDVTDKL